MGEAADDAIDRGMDEWMSDEYDDDQCFSFTPSPRTCRYCRATDLHWGIFAGGYRLFNAAGEMHNCAPKAKEVFKK